MLFPLELKHGRTLWSEEVVCAGFCGLLGEEPTALVLRPTCLSKAVPAEHRAVGLSVSSLGSQCWRCTLMLKGREENGTSQPLGAEKGVCITAVREALPEERIISPCVS